MLWQIVGQSSLSASQIVKGIECVKETSGIQLAYTEAGKWINEAKQSLQGHPVNGYRTALESLTDHLAQRLG